MTELYLNTTQEFLRLTIYYCEVFGLALGCFILGRMGGRRNEE